MMQGYGPIGSCFHVGGFPGRLGKAFTDMEEETAKGASLEEKEFIIHEID